MTTKVGLAQRLKAHGFDKPYVRLVRVSAQDRNKIDAHITAYAMISKQDGLPTVRLVFQNFTDKNGTMAVTYDMGRIHAWASKLTRFIEAVMLARALMAAGLVEFYDDVSEQATTSKPSQTSTSTMPANVDMAQLMALAMSNPQLLAQLMAMLQGKTQQSQEKGESHGERIEL